jgi:hypothetical protein
MPEVIERSVSAATDKGAVLAYCFRVARDVIQNRGFRQQVCFLFLCLFSMELLIPIDDRCCICL